MTDSVRPDPRVLFAAERTLLAWIRTSLSIMGIGFVIARFGLFLHLISLQAPAERIHANSGVSAILGIVFVVTGSAATFVASFQHRRFLSGISEADVPKNYSTSFTYLFGLFMGTMGIGLAVFLLLSQT